MLLLTETLLTETAVVGGGVIGLACAWELARHGREVTLIERHDRFGVETSSRNSEVVHAGIYYPPGSLKALLCVRGNASLYRWCEQHDIPHRRTGKLIVATSPEEEPRLEDIRQRAAANGITLEWLSAGQVRGMEPHVRATSALWSPTTGIVDSHQLMASLLQQAESLGCLVAFRHQLTSARREDTGYVLEIRAGEDTMALRCRQVVNAAGLEADIVAAMPGLNTTVCGYQLHYARGHYFRVHPRKQHLATRLIYPVPGDAALGIHVTLDLTGALRLGPDIEYLADRTQNYSVSPGLATAFFAAASRYLEGLELDDLAPDQAGIRPKLQAPGAGFRDFVIAEESARGLPGWINLIGIESPGLTCSLEIAARVHDLLEETSFVGA